MKRGKDQASVVFVLPPEDKLDRLTEEVYLRIPPRVIPADEQKEREVEDKKQIKNFLKQHPFPYAPSNWWVISEALQGRCVISSDHPIVVLNNTLSWNVLFPSSNIPNGHDFALVKLFLNPDLVQQRAQNILNILSHRWKEIHSRSQTRINKLCFQEFWLHVVDLTGDKDFISKFSTIFSPPDDPYKWEYAIHGSDAIFYDPKEFHFVKKRMDQGRGKEQAILVVTLRNRHTQKEEEIACPHLNFTPFVDQPERTDRLMTGTRCAFTVAGDLNIERLAGKYIQVVPNEFRGGYQGASNTDEILFKDEKGNFSRTPCIYLSPYPESEQIQNWRMENAGFSENEWKRPRPYESFRHEKEKVLENKFFILDYQQALREKLGIEQLRVFLVHSLERGCWAGGLHISWPSDKGFCDINNHFYSFIQAGKLSERILAESKTISGTYFFQLTAIDNKAAQSLDLLITDYQTNFVPILSKILSQWPEILKSNYYTADNRIGLCYEMRSSDKNKSAVNFVLSTGFQEFSKQQISVREIKKDGERILEIRLPVVNNYLVVAKRFLNLFEQYLSIYANRQKLESSKKKEIKVETSKLTDQKSTVLEGKKIEKKLEPKLSEINDGRVKELQVYTADEKLKLFQRPNGSYQLTTVVGWKPQLPSSSIPISEETDIPEEMLAELLAETKKQYDAFQDPTVISKEFWENLARKKIGEDEKQIEMKKSVVGGGSVFIYHCRSDIMGYCFNKFPGVLVLNYTILFVPRQCIDSVKVFFEQLPDPWELSKRIKAVKIFLYELNPTFERWQLKGISSLELNYFSQILEKLQPLIFQPKKESTVYIKLGEESKEIKDRLEREVQRYDEKIITSNMFWNIFGDPKRQDVTLLEYKTELLTILKENDSKAELKMSLYLDEQSRECLRVIFSESSKKFYEILARNFLYHPHLDFPKRDEFIIPLEASAMTWFDTQFRRHFKKGYLEEKLPAKKEYKKDVSARTAIISTLEDQLYFLTTGIVNQSVIADIVEKIICVPRDSILEIYVLSKVTPASVFDLFTSSLLKDSNVVNILDEYKEKFFGTSLIDADEKMLSYVQSHLTNNILKKITVQFREFGLPFPDNIIDVRYRFAFPKKYWSKEDFEEKIGKFSSAISSLATVLIYFHAGKLHFFAVNELLNKKLLNRIKQAKKDIQEFDESLGKVLTLMGFNFVYKNDFKKLKAPLNSNAKKLFEEMHAVLEMAYRVSQKYDKVFLEDFKLLGSKTDKIIEIIADWQAPQSEQKNTTLLFCDNTRKELERLTAAVGNKAKLETIFPPDFKQLSAAKYGAFPLFNPVAGSTIFVFIGIRGVLVDDAGRFNRNLILDIRKRLQGQNYRIYLFDTSPLLERLVVARDNFPKQEYILGEIQTRYASPEKESAMEAVDFFLNNSLSNFSPDGIRKNIKENLETKEEIKYLSRYSRVDAIAPELISSLWMLLSSLSIISAYKEADLFLDICQDCPEFYQKLKGRYAEELTRVRALEEKVGTVQSKDWKVSEKAIRLTYSRQIQEYIDKNLSLQKWPPAEWENLVRNYQWGYLIAEELMDKYEQKIQRMKEKQLLKPETPQAWEIISHGLEESKCDLSKTTVLIYNTGPNIPQIKASFGGRLGKLICNAVTWEKGRSAITTEEPILFKSEKPVVELTF